MFSLKMRGGLRSHALNHRDTRVTPVGPCAVPGPPVTKERRRGANRLRLTHSAAGAETAGIRVM